MSAPITEKEWATLAARAALRGIALHVMPAKYIATHAGQSAYVESWAELVAIVEAAECADT